MVSRIEGQTLAAGVECIFSCLNASIPLSGTQNIRDPKITSLVANSQAALNEHISQIPPVVSKAVTYGGKAIYSIKYAGLKSAFEKLGVEVSNPHSKLANGESNNDFQAALLSLASQLLFRDLDLSVENTRHSRAQAALAYMHICNGVKIKVPDEQRQQVEEWLATERSGQVQAVLRQVLEKIL